MLDPVTVFSPVYVLLREKINYCILKRVYRAICLVVKGTAHLFEVLVPDV